MPPIPSFNTIGTPNMAGKCVNNYNYNKNSDKNVYRVHIFNYVKFLQIANHNGRPSSHKRLLSGRVFPIA